VDRLARELHRNHAGGLRLLDVGVSFQTELFRSDLDGVTVDALDLSPPPIAPADADPHFVFDLNEADREELWPRIGPYHLIVLAEVIEHLSRSPVAVLRCVESWLTDDGYLILQTPNAVALHKRIRMLLGRQPFGPMPEDRSGDRHVREYVADELTAAGRRAGLSPVSVDAVNYFRTSRATRSYAQLGSVLPRSLRQGLTIAFRRD
jgi:2-polyprenyl-3-methyl-5-hydroxy-6-metoxy-1,4-benzoquinol methylase